MNKKNVIIVGSSGHAKVIIDIFEKQGDHQIIGLLDDFRSVGEETLGYKILGGIKDLKDIFPKHEPCEVFVAFGDNWARKKVVSMITSALPEVQFATAIHPSAQLGKGVVIGKGVAIMANAVVNPDCIIEEFCFLNTNSSADHDVVMKAYSSIGPSATLGGNVTLGEFSAISIGVTTKEKLNIGKHTIIGAGALLMSDTPDNVIMYGIPAKVIRGREIGEKYV
ncbi:MAG: acetyltransferase [Psychroserpens sp.]|nr:acetyltransferase [Psychroserpens sp.]